MATINGVAIMDTEDESSAERLSHEDDSDHDTSQEKQQQLPLVFITQVVEEALGFGKMEKTQSLCFLMRHQHLLLKPLNLQ